jgi:hypothetical protein
VILNVLEVLLQQVADLPGVRKIVSGRTFKQTAAACHPNGGVDDGLGCKSMKLTCFDPKYISGKIEHSNLTAAIGKQPIGTNSTLFDLIDQFGSFSLPEDLHIP